MLPEVDDIYEKGRFRRLVTDVTHLEVEYCLYTAEERWNQHGPNRVEWLKYRYYATTHKNWNRWVKGAKKLAVK